MCVCHHCDTSICVNPNHLFVGTNAENEADKVKKGRQSRGEKHRKALQHLDRKGEASPTAKLNWEKVKQIRASKESQRKVAKKYGVSQTVISNIKLEKTWRLDNG
jgi:DNA invertase Pin-like site-specific DNA recombinase